MKRHRTLNEVLYFLIGGFLICATSYAKDSELKTYSIQWQAFAPNAGGQQAYSLRRGDNDSEISFFLNQYLLVSKKPLYGLGYDFRFPICSVECFLQAYIQLGGGISNGGPYFDLTWSSVFLWSARIDFTTQLFFSKTRVITWSYPLWFGLSLPLPW